MSYSIKNDPETRYVQACLKGNLGQEENDALMEDLASLPSGDTIALLITFVDFDGLDLGAVDAGSRARDERIDRFEKVAVVADVGDQKVVATIVEPFASAQVQFFDHSNAGDATAWLSAD